MNDPETSKKRPRIILGLAASHNGSTCLLVDDEIVVAIQEERLTRRKRARLDPANVLGLDYCLAASGFSLADIDAVAVATLEDRAAAANALAQYPRLARLSQTFVTHHRAHAVAAWVQSGFGACTVLVIDGAGSPVRDLSEEESSALVGSPSADARESLSIYRAGDGELVPIHKIAAEPAPRRSFEDGDGNFDPRPWMMPFTSLGVMYQSVAQQIFGQWDAAGKVMGLAPYGTATGPPMVQLAHGGRLRFDDSVCASHRTRDRWPQRESEYQNLAATVQRDLECVLLDIAGFTHQAAPSSRLAYAGGVALNSVANARLAAEGPFDDVFVMAAAEDSGTSIGAAYSVRLERDGARVTDGRRGALVTDAFGRDYTAEIATVITPRRLTETLAEAHGDAPGAPPTAALTLAPSDDDLAELLAEGVALGWFHGRSELGPRALGQRSILLDPRAQDGKARLNARVKHREPFRPFAPAILEERAEEWFDLPDGIEPRSRFMLHVWRFREGRAAMVPAVAHVDETGRVQTVPDNGSPLRRVLEAFDRLTGVPILLNTSFNIAGEPIVETPLDALRCWAGTGLDALSIGQFLVTKVWPETV